VKSPRSTSVPRAMQATYDAIVAPTDAFCRDHLNDEYRDLARAMTAALCRKRPSPWSGPTASTCRRAWWERSYPWLPQTSQAISSGAAEIAARIATAEMRRRATASSTSSSAHRPALSPAGVRQDSVCRFGDGEPGLDVSLSGIVQPVVVETPDCGLCGKGRG
jgi:hypothetical protein